MAQHKGAVPVLGERVDLDAQLLAGLRALGLEVLRRLLHPQPRIVRCNVLLTPKGRGRARRGRGRASLQAAVAAFGVAVPERGMPLLPLPPARLAVLLNGRTAARRPLVARRRYPPPWGAAAAGCERGMRLPPARLAVLLN